VRMASNPNNSASSDDSNSSVFYHEDQAMPLNDRFFSRNAITSEETGSISSPLPVPGKGYATNNNMLGVEETVLPTHEQLMAIRHKKKVRH